MKRVGYVHAFHQPGRVGALVHGEVLGDSGASFVGQLPGALIAHPAVNTAAAGVDPEEVLEAEVVAEALVDDLHGDCHEGPALVADVRGGAAVGASEKATIGDGAKAKDARALETKPEPSADDSLEGKIRGRYESVRVIERDRV